MDLTFDAADEEYRAELRAWLAANVASAEPRERGMEARLRAGRDWQRRLHEAGYLALSWPRRWGGAEATLTQQVVAAQEFARAKVPSPIGMVGLSILGPTLITHGDDAQRARYLERILRADDLWCQGFSEPEAGSDLAALRTRAVVDGDELVVTGQKVWTSLGFAADRCFLLARTDPDAPRHQGISYLLCEMDTPGITVRPLRNAAGGTHFCEVFFDEVRVPLANVVGELHGGWGIARTSLDNERSGLAGVIELERRLASLARMVDRVADDDGGSGERPPGADGRLAQLWIEVEALRYLGYRTLSGQLNGREVGAEAAVGKLFATSLRQRIARTGLDLQGPLAQLTRSAPDAVDRGRWQTGYLDALAYTIGGGTSEVMRNVIAERVLGLPRGQEER
jgi:alkylation response protein AidB-like acyl-CoA dehydrogenase